MRKIFIAALMINGCVMALAAQEYRFDPPCNTPPDSKVMFTVPGIDNVPDLFGDINDPQLVVFFAGNQFMCIDDLLSGFKKTISTIRKGICRNLTTGHFGKAN